MASSSIAKRIDVNIGERIRRGCWKNWKNFLKFYGKEITECVGGFRLIEFAKVIIMYDFYIVTK